MFLTSVCLSQLLWANCVVKNFYGLFLGTLCCISLLLDFNIKHKVVSDVNILYKNIGTVRAKKYWSLIG